MPTAFEVGQSSRRTALMLALFLLQGVGVLLAQESADPPPALSTSQQQILRDYERFEKSLFDVAEQARRKDPERAELLYRARSRSQEQNILSEMQAISELLGGAREASPQFGPAVDRQRDLVARMETVLKLLQSLDDRERVAAEVRRIQELLEDTNRLIAHQKDLRAETLRPRKSAEQLKSGQEKIANEADLLAKKIDSQDQSRNQERSGDKDSQDTEKAPSESEDSEQQPGDSPDKPQDGKKKPAQGDPQESDSSQQPMDGQESSGDSSQGENSQSEQSPQEQSPDQQQSPSEGKPESESQPQQKPQDAQQTAGREQLEQARREMQQAIEELEKQNREKAQEEQHEAVARLEEMKARLEEILRQLREEEKESYLTLLEARFQNMLKRQQRINAETTRLNLIPATDRPQQNYASQTDTIRKEQSDNALEAEKALLLLKQEGSSVAFPEAVEQMHRNMLVVVNRLAAQDTGATTQTVELLVIQTLDEMIQALRRELEKKDNQQGGGSGQQGQQQDPALVDQLAELKLIRSLEDQIRILTRTIGTELEGKPPTRPDQINLIRDLEVRQKRIKEATYDLSVGRNQ